MYYKIGGFDMRKCKVCGVSDSEKFCPSDNKNWCSECRSIYNREKGLYLKLKAIEFMGGKCCKCGYDKVVSAFDFHHEDNNSKEFLLSSLFKKGAYWDEIEKELKKCILLCANCHRELHYGIPVSGYKFRFDIDKYFKVRRRKRVGGIQKNPIICQNPVCKKEFYNHVKRKFCSLECSSEAHRKVIHRPSKEYLKDLIDRCSFVVIGKKFGVSDNSIRNWAKQYNLI